MPGKKPEGQVWRMATWNVHGGLMASIEQQQQQQQQQQQPVKNCGEWYFLSLKTLGFCRNLG